MKNKIKNHNWGDYEKNVNKLLIENKEEFLDYLKNTTETFFNASIEDNILILRDNLKFKIIIK